MHRYLLTLFVLFAKVSRASLTIRIRLPNGSMQRLSLDNEHEETIETLRCKISEHFSIPTECNSTLSISSVKYTWADGHKNATKLSDLGIKPGEVVEIISELPLGDAGSKREAVGSKSSSSSIKSSSASPSGAKKVASLAELQRLRKEMIKVTRQRASGKRAVAVSTSVAGIIKKRVSAGGIALLIGRSLVEPAQKGGGKTRVMSGGDDSNNRRECIEVHAACEIFHGKTFPNDISNDATVARLISIGTVAEIAKKLGLGVVGCAIGYPCASDKNKVPLWSPLHVVTALQLKPLAGSNRFVILSAGPEVETNAEPETAARKQGSKIGRTKGLKPGPGSKTRGGEMEKSSVSGASVGKTRKQLKGGGMVAGMRSATRGISLEAFEFSDQAATLVEREILPTQLTAIAGVGGKKAKASIKASKQKSGAGSKSKTKGETQTGDETEKLVLNSPVLIANGVETQEIDPYLLAVPMPIVTIGMGSAPPRKPKKGIVTAKTASTPPWRPPSLGISFEHSFPSAAELEDAKLFQKASKHVLQVLSARPPMVARMRDVQLLLHLSKLLDSATMQALCDALAQPGTALPQGVLSAMEMTKLSLASSAAGEVEDL